jgi:N-dimethylarginine dimethylaminohydrolase
MQRFLVCPPDYFDSSFMFNPWMEYTESVDLDLAKSQWETLVSALIESGAEVELMTPSPHSPAQVFTADGAVVYGSEQALVLRNDGPRGTIEPINFSEWLRSDGYTVESMPLTRTLDGGNIVRLHDGSFACGVKPNSDGSGGEYFKKILQLTSDAELHRFQLVDRKYLHLDMALGKIGSDAYLVYEDAFEDGLSSLEASPVIQKEIIRISRADAERFACNGVTVGNTFLTGLVSKSLVDSIARLGYRPITLDLSEFHKAGGGLKCLTLPLN